MLAHGADHKYKFCEGGGGPVGMCLPGGNARGQCLGVTSHMYHQNGINGKLKKAPKPEKSDGRRRLSGAPAAESDDDGAGAPEAATPEAAAPAAAAPAAAAAAKKHAVLSYDGVGGRVKLKLTLPPAWAAKPCSKLAAAVAKAANAKGATLAAANLALFRADGSRVPPHAPLGGLPDGAALTVRDA